MQEVPLGRLIIYARDVEATIRFYEKHFGFLATRIPTDRIVELSHPEGGANLMIHAAATSQRMGQSTVKLVFDVEDIEAFVDHASTRGLSFGAVHQADGYAFANAKDPDGNPISVSSRAFRRPRKTVPTAAPAS